MYVEFDRKLSSSVFPSTLSFLSAPLSLSHQTSTAAFLSLSGLYHYHHSTTVLAYGGKDVISDPMEAQMTSTVVWALGKPFFIRFVFLSSK
jgi:hypothetical protein